MRNRLSARASRIEIDEQRAILASYRALCASGPAAGVDATAREEAENAYRRYREAQCRLVENDLERGRGDLEFGAEILDAFRVMRDAQVVTRLDVIDAETEVDLARTTVAQSKRRLETCRAEIAGLARESSEQERSKLELEEPEPARPPVR